MTLLARVQAALSVPRLGPGPLLVAVSGGADSMALLDILTRLPALAGSALVVAHVDHGIHADSAAVAAMVRDQARRRGLRFVSTELALGADASETAARRGRLAWLRAEARRQAARWIVLGHQADDQQETALMRFLRGSGPAGLSGMRPRDGMLLRPLLGIRRATVRRYAEARGLTWWDDPANADPRHLRSWLRQQLLPQIADRLPDLPARLERGRRQAAADRRAWDAALATWPGLALREGGALSVDWAVLHQLPVPLAQALTQALLRRAGGPAGPVRIRRALVSLSSARSGASADLGQGWRAEISFDRLRVIAPVPSATAECGEPATTIAAAVGQTRWAGWTVRWTMEPAPLEQPRDGHTAWFIPGALSLRAWRPGDRLAPLGGRGQRLAVRCFQDAHVPRDVRRSWPMIEGSGALAWIPGVCRSGLLLPGPGETALRIDVDPPH